MVLKTTKQARVTVIEELCSGSDGEDVPADGFSEDSGPDSDEDSVQNEVPEGNPSWADAISGVLRAKKPKNKKSIILAKAKKDIDIQKKYEMKKVFEVVTSEGKVENIEEPVSVKKKRNKKPDYNQSSSGTDEELNPQEFKRRKTKRILWEGMCRVKPNALEKDRERELTRTATKGVVQLFNAVRQHQKKLDTKLKGAGNSEVKQENVMKSVSKGAFLDLLKGCPSQKVSSTGTSQEKVSSVKQTPTSTTESSGGGWSVFNEDLLLRASLKDWDKVEDPQT